MLQATPTPPLLHSGGDMLVVPSIAGAMEGLGVGSLYERNFGITQKPNTRTTSEATLTYNPI